MNGRWHQLVMIGTATIMILLSLHGNYLRWQKLQKICPPHLKPTKWLWPVELKDRLNTCTEYDKESAERQRLRVRAKRFGVTLDESDTLEEWIDQVENKAKHEVLIEKARAKQDKLGFLATKALGEIESEPRIWNLGLLGFSTVKIEDMSVMKYEFTQASAWLLGVDLRDKCGLFCPAQVSFEDAKNLADTLSQMMGFPSCYRCIDEDCYNSCVGWKLPTTPKWLLFRGDIDQQWRYISWPKGRALSPTGKRGGNQNHLHDIVGNSLEWSHVGEGLGGRLDGSEIVEQGQKIGFRLYRSTEANLKNEKK